MIYVIKSSEDLLLPEMQRRYIQTVLKNTNAKVILVLFSGGGSIDLSQYINNEKIVGIVAAGYTGMAGGQAVAEILAGKVNPSRCSK